MGDFERIIETKVRPLRVQDNGELVLSQQDALAAIALASDSLIAILGVEQFMPQTNGLLVMDYSGYEFELQSSAWSDFVRLNNEEAKTWILKRAVATSGFILTTTSYGEFSALRPQLL